MSLLKRITENELPIKQQRVIENILEDLETNAFLTGHEICQKFHVSFSSLTRMSKSLCYTGFPELKKEIENLYKNEFSPTGQAESFISSTKEGSILDIVYQDEINRMAKLRKSLDEEQLLNIVKKINNAKRVFLVGVGVVEPIVHKFASSLKLLGLQCHTFTSLGFSKQTQIHSLNQSDVAIIFSINKELLELKEFLEELSDKETTSVLFTDKRAARLSSHATYSLYTPSQGSAMINCLTPYLVATNIVESYLFSLDKHAHLSKIKNIEKQWDDLPIFLT